MEPEASIGSSESADLVNERRKRMLARLEARHKRDAVGTKTSSNDTADFDKLLAKATRLINSTELNTEPEFIHELETALALIPPGRQSHCLKQALNVLRSKMQEQVGLRHQQSSFAFSAKREDAAEPKVQKVAPPECSPLGPTQISAKPLMQKAITVNAEDGKELVLEGNDGEEVLINNVRNSVIRVPFKASAVHIKFVEHTTLIFAPIKSSLLMRNCENLTVAVAAQQVRVHDSHRIRFYVEVRGALIIEDCDGVEVAPYNVVGFQREVQNVNWPTVQDFSWLSSEEHSPNWKIMKENAEKYFTL